MFPTRSVPLYAALLVGLVALGSGCRQGSGTSRTYADANPHFTVEELPAPLAPADLAGPWFGYTRLTTVPANVIWWSETASPFRLTFDEQGELGSVFTSRITDAGTGAIEVVAPNAYSLVPDVTTYSGHYQLLADGSRVIRGTYVRELDGDRLGGAFELFPLRRLRQPLVTSDLAGVWDGTFTSFAGATQPLSLEIATSGEVVGGHLGPHAVKTPAFVIGYAGVSEGSYGRADVDFLLEKRVFGQNERVDLELVLDEGLQVQRGYLFLYHDGAAGTVELAKR